MTSIINHRNDLEKNLNEFGVGQTVDLPPFTCKPRLEMHQTTVIKVVWRLALARNVFRPITLLGEAINFFYFFKVRFVLDDAMCILD